jgi:hypothetical protein
MVMGTEQVASSTSLPRTGSRAARAIVSGGLIAGALDITYAFIAWGLLGAAPMRISQSVAAGLIGPQAAVSGGVPTGVLGLFLHFTIAIIMAAVYYGAATRMRVLVKRPVACGLTYGFALYLVMNFVVMPLSAIGAFGGTGPTWIPVTGILVHMFFVGLPIALMTRRALQRM